MRCHLLLFLITLHNCYSFTFRTSRTALNGNLDYEYIPPSPPNHADDAYDHLPSAYPPGTPAGLIGEAVQSALRSEQCVAWKLDSEPLQQALVKARGTGTIQFLNNQLTQTFTANQFQEACLLNAKGRCIDRLSVAVTTEELAYLLTSPGHTQRFQRLDPFVFPLDQVQLEDCTDSSTIFSLSSVKKEHVQKAFDTFVVPMLPATTMASTTLPGCCG